jgi:CBS domain-containing protein
MEEPVSFLKPGKPVTLPPTATVADAMQIMLAQNIGALLIVSDDKRLLGIFSERDLLTKIAGIEPDYATKPVEKYMTPNPETVKPTDSLSFALHKMDVGGYRHLPVMKDGCPLGMISVRDMLRYITHLCKDR